MTYRMYAAVAVAVGLAAGVMLSLLDDRSVIASGAVAVTAGVASACLTLTRLRSASAAAAALKKGTADAFDELPGVVRRANELTVRAEELLAGAGGAEERALIADLRSKYREVDRDLGVSIRGLRERAELQRRVEGLNSTVEESYDLARRIDALRIELAAVMGRLPTGSPAAQVEEDGGLNPDLLTLLTAARPVHEPQGRLNIGTGTATVLAATITGGLAFGVPVITDAVQDPAVNCTQYVEHLLALNEQFPQLSEVPALQVGALRYDAEEEECGSARDILRAFEESPRSE